jgi:hypothetical protein
MTNTQVYTEESWRMPGLSDNTAVASEEFLDDAVTMFDPIDLPAMDTVALLNRFDTKFVLSRSQLITALKSLQADYRILTINCQRAHHYSTLYYDTKDFAFYHDHVTGRSNVYKVRAREYLDTQISYLEVKHKNQKKYTDKSRLPIPSRSERLDEPMLAFLDRFKSFAGQTLEPKLWNTFRRITLVSKTDLERVTIDVDLCFYNDRHVLNLDRVAVAEVKQDHCSQCSPFMAEMRRQGIREMGFSKYCFGVSQLVPTVKKNTQKEKVLWVEKLQRGELRRVTIH